MWQGVKGHPLAPWWPQGLRSSLGLHLPALFPVPSGGGGCTFVLPSLGSSFMVPPQKGASLQMESAVQGGSTPLCPSLLHFLPPPPRPNWQNLFLKCTLGVDITMKNLQWTRMPHPKNGPRDLSPASQLASPSAYASPLYLFPLSSFPPSPSSHPFRCALLTSAQVSINRGCWGGGC